jgi:hypothetical protein
MPRDPALSKSALQKSGLRKSAVQEAALQEPALSRQALPTSTPSETGPRPAGPRLHRPGLFALLVLDGLLLGGIGLVLTPMYAGPIPTPVGALLSIALLPWLVLRTGELDARPAVAGAPLLAWLLAVGVLGVGGPGGDVLLPATWQSGLLVFGGLFGGLLALRKVLMGEAAGERGPTDVRSDG